MRFLFRRTALAAAAGSIMIWCSCERHHPGELAPAQDTAMAEGKVPNEQRSPAAKPIPAQFFAKPSASPR
jgi:hypothetical protein